MQLLHNVGPIDRVIRVIIGIGALAAAFFSLNVMSGSLVGILAAAVRVIMLGTAAMGTCPLYMPFKMSTCKAKQS